MRIKRNEYGVNLWLSARDTYEWAHKSGAAWPCSQISGRRLFAAFERNGDLVDVSIDGGRGKQNVDGNEFNAITADFLNA